MVRHQFFINEIMRTAAALSAPTKRRLALPLVALLLLLAVASAGQAAGQAALVTLDVSAPANGSYFVVGEKPVVTVTLPAGLSKDDFSSLNLYLYGPQETNKTVTAVKLLNASTDRATRPHHYIDLINNSDVQVNGNVLTYNLQAVSDEEPGTYTASLWAVTSADSLDQAMPLYDFQIGTETVETQIVDKSKCAKCHLGASNGQFYFHHVDPSPSGSPGNPALESWPVRTCKSCHNTDGYAAYRDPNNPSVRIPDPIVHRVHGLHMGIHLENPIDFDPNTGIFKDYTKLEFPADIRNCTTCHVDDRWKTKPSRLACGACHDNIWFGNLADMPATGEAHPGGPQFTDNMCTFCHPADGSWVEGTAPAPISTVHKVEPPAFKDIVELSMSTPANGSYYVAGETPQVTITIKDAATGKAIDPATIVEPADSKNVQPNEWQRANLYVSGPRMDTKPVLTPAADNPDPNAFYAENDLRIHNDPNKNDPRITRTATSIVYQLDDVAGLKPGTYTTFVEVTPSSVLGGWQVMNFQVGTATVEPKVATNCTDCHGDTRRHVEYFAVKFNTDICKSCHDYEHQGQSIGWAYPGGWNGFGAQPLVKKVHGVHFGHYLHKPEDIVYPALRTEFDYSGTIFPQEVRNCVKCHSADTAGTWKTEPKRLACLACHDSDESIFHGDLMTYDPTMDNPYSGDEIETCEVCHGADTLFSPDKMHNIWDPYKPPYPREPVKEDD
jgi:Outer membrane cytochrome MtrC/MtrF-like, domains II/IV